MRVAELWMDEYKKYFYSATWSWPSKRTAFNDDDRRSLEVRRRLKTKLRCRNFSWYLQSIIPEVTMPANEFEWYGEIANINSEACWFVTPNGYVALTYFCFFHQTLPDNVFHITPAGRLMYKNSCVRVEPATWLLQLTECENMVETELWELEPLREQYGIPNEVIMNVKFNHKDSEVVFCLVQATNINKVLIGEQMPLVIPCNKSNSLFHWRWTYKFDFGNKFPNG